MEAKKTIRAQVKQRISDLTSAERRRSDDQIQSKLKALVSSYSTVVSYKALEDEVSVEGLPALCVDGLCAEDQSAKSQSWVYPRVQQDQLHFFECNSEDDFEQGAFGVLEPKMGHELVNVNECDAMLVPGRAFDRDGQRLGRGKSYYDRILKEYTGQKIGVCYSQQIWDEGLPVEDWDIAMDIVVTENYVLHPVRK